jgi:hypothetical protein
MTLNLTLPPDVERRLQAAASSRGVGPEEYALGVLQRDLSSQSPQSDASAVLQSWIDQGDPDEQRTTYEYLTRVLDEDRPSDRKLFPPELKGLTW